GTHREGVTVGRQGQAVAELLLEIEWLQIGFLAPGGTVTGEDIHSTGIDISRYHFAISVFGQVVALVAVDAQRRAVFQQCSNRQGIAIGRQGDAIAEAIVSNDQVFIFVGLFGIGSFDVSLL